MGYRIVGQATQGPIVNLELIQKNGHIILVGNGWNLLSFKPDGSVHRINNLARNEGFPVDNNERLAIED